MPKPFLVLQLRPETDASDQEFEAIVKFSGLKKTDFHRIRIERTGLVEKIRLENFAGVIVGGGPSNVSAPESKKYPEQKVFEPRLKNLVQEIVDKDFPYLGACYGLGILADVMGASIDEKYAEDVGAVLISLTDIGKTDPIFQNIADPFYGYVGHKEACRDLSSDIKLLASSEQCPVQAVRVKTNIYATQFHPELDHPTLASRVNIYKHHGYFAPEESEPIIKTAKQYTVTEPMKILKNFVGIYRGYQANN